MGEKIIFEKDNSSVKNPRHLQKNVFILYSPRAVKMEPPTYRKIDTEITAFLPRENIKI